jgi:GTPase
MKKLHGNLKGLKPNQIRRLENLYRRRVTPEFLITPELARDICFLSHEIHRQIGLLINRQGKIAFVVIGTHHDIVIPETQDYRSAPDRLKGLRCVHTHLDESSLTRDDTNDLALLRLDLMAVLTVTEDGEPDKAYVGHILPKSAPNEAYRILAPLRMHQLNIGCLSLIQALESEMSFSTAEGADRAGLERALLISATSAPKNIASASMDELKELARSGGIEVVDAVIVHRRSTDGKFFTGSGKIRELTILALQKGASLLIFDQELSPSQIRSITDQVDIKVIDRTQLILDIFAQRALSREGKLQVELAQLRYLLPRLVTKNTAMSRLTGGIGGRGPGETKLEINRRRVRERITHLEKLLEQVQKQRKQQRARRSKKDLPVISIIGYTNAGKSTLLNTLTKSRVLAESRLFATLDPSSRRLKFPEDLEVIVTDTVGFIRDLPKDLRVAFRATLEELENADLLLHVVDVSNPRFRDQMDSVAKILEDLDLQSIPVVLVLNKCDRLSPQTISDLTAQLHGILVCALNESSLAPLVDQIRAAAAFHTTSHKND